MILLTTDKKDVDRFIDRVLFLLVWYDRSSMVALACASSASVRREKTFIPCEQDVASCPIVYNLFY
jgi:hypothetical protein